MPYRQAAAHSGNEAASGEKGSGVAETIPGQRDSRARFDPDDNKPQSHAKSTRPAATNPAGLSDAADQSGTTGLLRQLPVQTACV